jgi:hypothetical protein
MLYRLTATTNKIMATAYLFDGAQLSYFSFADMVFTEMRI